MFRKAVLLFFLFLSSSLLQAQTTDDHLGSWTEIIGQNQISEKWSIPTTLILQHNEVLNNFQFILLRSGISYHFSNSSKVTFGYDYFYSESFNEENSILQHRIWEELSLGRNYLKWNVSHRYRLESTWTKQEPEYAFDHRVRYRLKLEHPLYREFYITSFNEIFINLDKPYFNQNRLHVGLGYTLHPDLKLEIGYFKNHFSRLHFDRIRLGLVFRTRILTKNSNL